jgi:hypothetical protein
MNKTQALAAIKAGRKMGLCIQDAPLVRKPGAVRGSTIWGVKVGFAVYWTRQDIEWHARQYAGYGGGGAICG